MRSIATETAEQKYDDEARLYRSLWFEVLNRAIADVEIERQRYKAFSFLCSSDCEQVCTMLSLDVEILRVKFVPATFRTAYEKRMAQKVIAPLPTMAHREVIAASSAFETQAEPVMPTESLVALYAGHTFDSRSINQ